VNRTSSCSSCWPAYRWRAARIQSAPALTTASRIACTASVDLTDTQAPATRGVSDALASRLRSEWVRLQDGEGIEHLAIAVSGPAGDWSSPMPDGIQGFYWASVGKLATAVLLQQLAQENRLQLNQRLSQWYPDPAWCRRHHTGNGALTPRGLYQPQRVRGVPPSRPARNAGGRSPIPRGRPLLFCPGTDWYYSNSGYMLLGRIIEQATGDSFSSAVATRIAEPIGASSLAAMAQGESPSTVVPAYPRTQVNL
jgi:D-alanyl-D-alanine carboxypeptidase